MASIRLDTEGIDLLCALLQVGHQSRVTPADLSHILTLCALLLPQFDTRSRISAEAALRHSYFLSLGENIHNLPDSELCTSHLLTRNSLNSQRRDSWRRPSREDDGIKGYLQISHLRCFVPFYFEKIIYGAFHKLFHQLQRQSQQDVKVLTSLIL